MNVDNFRNDLGEIVEGRLAYGMRRNDIFVLSPSYVRPGIWATLTGALAGGSDAEYAQFRQASAAIAAQYSTKYVDVYSFMESRGGTSLLHSDGIHPVDAGHRAIADAVIAVMQS